MKGFKNIFLAQMLAMASHYTMGRAVQQPAGDFLAGSISGDKNVPDAEYANTPVITEKEFAVSNVLDTPENKINPRYQAVLDRLKIQAEEIRAYASRNQFSGDYCFLVDMSVPSGMNRFFVYDLKADKVVNSSLVAHGFGSTLKDGSGGLIFSNNNNSFKTSLGKYKIGHAYNGTYGLAYKLYGLDDTNSKAYERAIVLHADTHMPETEVFPRSIFQSAGCPTVSPGFLPVLSEYIKSSKQPVLMWIYY